MNNIYNELNSRLQNIEQLLKENNLSTIEYFKSLKDIQDIDIIYKNNISQEEIQLFLENIKIGLDTKIDIFIDMLNKGNSNILKHGNKETLEGYPNINLSQFWSRYKDRIKQKLFVELKEEQRYDTARKIVDKFVIKNSVDKQILIFIDMLNQGNSNILKNGNKETLEGYPNINLSQFWNKYRDRIKQKLFAELKDNPQYEKARELIEINEVENNIETKIEIFINMLNQGNSNILKHGNKETLEGYPNINLSRFWSKHQDRIKQKLFVELKDDSKYDKARELIVINKITINVDNQIPIFIEMLNKGDSNILKYGNKETLEGYPNINLSQFWSRHQDRIKQKLFVELKDDSKYDKARELLTINDVENNIETKIDIFIDMLNKGNDKILKRRNKETLEGYPNINLSQFWSYHQTRIKQKLFVELKDDSKYDKARELIEINEVENNIETKIEIFINMLNKGNSNILKQVNKETLEGYANINLSQFWSRHQDRIKQKLFVELKDDLKYDKARELITTNETIKNIDNQIPIFIEMLNKGNSNILKYGNKETLKGYPNINLSHFWSKHQDRIKQKLFVELKYDLKYDKARELITTNETIKNIDNQIPIFIEMLNKGNSNILKNNNKETLEGHSNINLSYFWNNYKDRIKQKLFVELKDDSKYDKARELIEINEISINVDKQIPIFIDMLNKGNDKILKRRNKETLEGYPNINLSHFWSKHQDRIKQKLFVELKDNHEYDIARQLIEIYEISINVDKQIPIFIDMLNKGNNKILKAGNKETLEGYPNINLLYFWNNYKDRIKAKLFIELKDNPEYNTARQTVLAYFKVLSYEELEAKQNKGKKLQEDKKIKKELVDAIKYIDEVDLTEQEQRKRA